MIGTLPRLLWGGSGSPLAVDVGVLEGGDGDADEEAEERDRGGDEDGCEDNFKHEVPSL